MAWYKCGGNGSLPSINFSRWSRYKNIESASVMELSFNSSSVTSKYKGGMNIGCNFSVPIDVTDINEISGYADIGTGYNLSNFPFYVALCEKYPYSIGSTPSAYSPIVTDSCNTANATYNFSLDTSNLTGGYILLFMVNGMNATIRDIILN